MSDEIWLAVRASRAGATAIGGSKVVSPARLRPALRDPSRRVDALVEPAAYRPRPNAGRRSKRRAWRRRGDPTSGGSTRKPIMTAYRQQALECAALARAPRRRAFQAVRAGRAESCSATSMAGSKVERGVYALSEAGRAALVSWATDFPASPPLRAANQKKYRRECEGASPKSSSGGDLDQVGRSSRGCAKKFGRGNNFGHRPNAGREDQRIVSTGQASAPGFWYNQDRTEWVFLIAGSAALLIEGESEPRILRPGGYVEFPAHMRHRVEWTDADQPTVRLALHLAG